jgi:hypothetical protein
VRLAVDIFTPRGVRNNNPGNIRRSGSAWAGLSAEQTDPEFARFDDAVMGLRALMRLLLAYRYKYGLESVEQIIRRFAPPHENDTDGYIRFAARDMGVKREDALDLSSAPRLVSLARAIVRRENGASREWYAPDIYARAAARALDFKERTLT